jgi:pimeloyl-ACP methyl ester carboxylesterase
MKPTPIAPLAKIARSVTGSDIRAGASLAVDATKGIVDLVEAMHATIARPFGMARADINDKTSGITGFVYNTVRGVTRVVGGSLDVALSAFTRLKSTDESSFERDAAISALNGVCGDHLVKTNNALAIPMTIRFEGKAIDFDTPLETQCTQVNGKVAILVHGLCMNDRQWLRNGHDHGAALANEFGYTPLYVRYNTGLHTSLNGEALSKLLEKLTSAWPEPIDEIVIVAHSMGGLVSRSAIHHADASTLTWQRHLKRVFFLGTPHHGAPLERGGRWIDLVLGATPYTKPFARLGKIRSAGITDLRYGNVLMRDWSNDSSVRTTTPLPKNVACFAVAATTGKSKHDVRDVVLGDGLVPVASALGKHRLIKHRLAFPERNTWIAYKRNHMDLLSDQETCAQITEWIRRHD